MRCRDLNRYGRSKRGSNVLVLPSLDGMPKSPLIVTLCASMSSLLAAV